MSPRYKTKYLSFLAVCITCILPTKAVDWAAIGAKFFVACKMLDLEKDLEIDLPLAEDRRANANQKVINIQHDGNVVMDEKGLTLDELQRHLVALVKLDKNQAIRVRGGADIDYNHIVQVIDRCRKAGVWIISFATAAPEKKVPVKKSDRVKLLYVIVVDADGAISINGKSLTEDALLKRLKALARVNKNQAIRLDGDALTEFKNIEKVVSLCVKAGITHISYKVSHNEPQLEKTIQK